MSNKLLINNVLSVEPPPSGTYQQVLGITPLKVDSTVAGELEEVEILGNTWQDAIDYSNIKHLGELQPDGRYKIEVESENAKNLAYLLETEVRGAYGEHIKKYSETSGEFKLTKSGQDVGVNLINSAKMLGRDKKCCTVVKFDKDISNIKFNYNKGYKILSDKKTLIYNSVTYGGGVSEGIYIASNQIPLNTLFKYEILGFFETDIYDLSVGENYQSSTQTLLLPCQLSKVGDVQDRLFYDKSKGEYVIEKKIDIPQGTNEPITDKFIMANPQLIPTGIKQEMKLSSYDETTHLFVEGGLNGGIKANVPVSKEEKIMITWEAGSLSSSTGAPKTSGSSWRFVDFVEIDTINFEYILKTTTTINYLHYYYYRDNKSYIGRTSSISTGNKEQEIPLVDGTRYIKMKGAPPSNAKMEDVLSITKIRRLK